MSATEDVQNTLGTRRSPGSRWLVRLGLLAVLAGAALLGVRAVRARAAGRQPSFVSQPARKADVLVTVTATGTLEAVTLVEVGAEVTGRVQKLTVGENDRVKKGQVLAVIDPEQLQAALDQAAAQVAVADAAILQAKATLAEAALVLERNRKLREQGLLGQAELDASSANQQRAEAALASAKANAALARAAHKLARSRLDKTTIVSPIDGVVLSRQVELGQTVTAGFQTPVLFRLAEDLTRMRVKAAIDEADVGRVRPGLSASFVVEAYPDRKFPSRVSSLGNDPKTTQNVVTYQAHLSVDNADGALRPGMTCTATIVAETKKDVLVVPNAALRFVPPAPRTGGPPKPPPAPDDKRRVYVLSGGKPLAVEVKTGATDGLVTELVSASLAPDTEVLVDVVESTP